MRDVLIILALLQTSVPLAVAQVSIGISVPGVSIGINMPLYPELVPVPGYPVYYAPGQQSNYFFYDGMYWVYQGDNWYASSWYNGPWGIVGPAYVPLFVLRIPVSYYRNPPGYFRGWRPDAPPRWDEHWGRQWAQQRRGWNQWDHTARPRAAPLPNYQRQYSGERYPRAEQQAPLHNQNYRYQPRTAVAREHYRAQPVQRAPAPALRNTQGGPAATRAQPQQNGTEGLRQEAPQPGRPAVQQQRPSPRPDAAAREQQVPRAQDPQRGVQVRPESPQPKANVGRRQTPERENNQERGQDRSQDKGQDRGKDRD